MFKAILRGIKFGVIAYLIFLLSCQVLILAL